MPDALFTKKSNRQHSKITVLSVFEYRVYQPRFFRFSAPFRTACLLTAKASSSTTAAVTAHTIAGIIVGFPDITASPVPKRTGTRTKLRIKPRYATKPTIRMTMLIQQSFLAISVSVSHVRFGFFESRKSMKSMKVTFRKKLIAAADSEASRCIQEANDSADLTRRHAEEAAERLRKTSEAQAADTVRKAEAAAALVLHNAEEAARATEEKAAADAELMLQRAQEDSNSFWQDVTELIQQKLFSNGGTGNGE